MEDLAYDCSILVEAKSKDFMYLDDGLFKVMETRFSG
jgi:hypothetical protein